MSLIGYRVAGVAGSLVTKNRERLLAGDIAQALFERVLAQARQSAPDLERALRRGRHADRGVGGAAPADLLRSWTVHPSLGIAQNWRATCSTVAALSAPS